MIIETQLTLKDYRRFCYAYLYSHPFYRLLTLYGIVMILGLVFYTPDNSIILSLQISSIIIILLVVPLRVSRNAECRFEGSSLLNEKKTYKFTDEKLSVTGETFKAEYQWDNVIKMKVLKNWCVIFMGKRTGFIFPNEAIGSNIEEFKKLVRGKIMEQKIKKNN